MIQIDLFTAKIYIIDSNRSVYNYSNHWTYLFARAHPAWIGHARASKIYLENGKSILELESPFNNLKFWTTYSNRSIWINFEKDCDYLGQCNLFWTAITNRSSISRNLSSTLVTFTWLKLYFTYYWTICAHTFISVHARARLAFGHKWTLMNNNKIVLLGSAAMLALQKCWKLQH